MGGLLHLFDFDKRSMARKVLSHKKHVDGMTFCSFFVLKKCVQSRKGPGLKSVT